MSDIQELINAPSKAEQIINPDELLSSGCAVLNIALSGSTKGAFVKGHYIHFAGASGSGKTWQALTILAEAANNSVFDGYDLVYDGPENGAFDTIFQYFGNKLKSRIVNPKLEKDLSVCSKTTEDFYFTLHNLQKKKKKFIYVLDSMDALQSVADQTKLEEDAGKHEKGKKSDKGSYGTGKAKNNSEYLRSIVNDLAKTGSILIIISQIRKNIGMGAMFNPDVVSGGEALTFFPHVRIWTKIKKTLKKDIKGKKYNYANIIQYTIKKNRIEGWEGTIDIPFLKRTGLDDVGATINFLTNTQHWKKTGGKVNAVELGLNLEQEALIAEIQNNKLEGKLNKVLRTVYKDILKQCTVVRKKKYE